MAGDWRTNIHMCTGHIWMESQRSIFTLRVHNSKQKAVFRPRLIWLLFPHNGKKVEEYVVFHQAMTCTFILPYGILGN